MSPLASWVVLIATVVVGLLAGCLLVLFFEWLDERRDRERDAFVQRSMEWAVARAVEDLLHELDDPDLTLEQRADLNHELNGMLGSEARRRETSR